MAKKQKPLSALPPEEVLFKDMPEDVRNLQRQARAMRRNKQREEFANRMISDPDTLGNR